MLIASDITVNLPFHENTKTGLTRNFVHSDVSPQAEPLYTIEMRENHKDHETDIRILKHEKVKTGWLYRVKFDGTINSPQDFRQLLKWLKII